MKYVLIAMLIFIINISMAMTNALGFYSFSLQEHDEWMNSVDEAEVSEESYVSSQVNSDTDFNFGDFVKGLWIFIKTFGLGVLAFGYTLKAFGLMYPFTWLITIIVWVIYALGISQYIANRTTKSMG